MSLNVPRISFVPWQVHTCTLACIYILPLPTPQDKVLYDTLQLQILSLHIFILVSVVDLAKCITCLIINYNWSTINCGMFWA